MIDVARDLFVEKGYDQTSIEEVLRLAGVSKGAIYHHFPSKEALFEAVFRDSEQRALERIEHAARTAEKPLDQLRIGCHAFLDCALEASTRRIYLQDGPAVLGWHRWREIDEEYSFGLTRGVLQKAIEHGEIPAQDVDLLAHMALAMLGEAAMVIARATDPTRARAEAGKVVDRLLDALTVGHAQAPKGARRTVRTARRA